MNDPIEVNMSDIQKIGKALSSKTRLKILNVTMDKAMDVSRIAEKLGQTESNISAQIKILEKAGLIKGEYEPGENGVRKICKPTTNKIIIQIRHESNWMEEGV